MSGIFNIKQLLWEIKKKSFLTNNFKGLKFSKRTIKLIEYFKSKLNHNGISFLKEKRPSIKYQNRCIFISYSAFE